MQFGVHDFDLVYCEVGLFLEEGGELFNEEVDVGEDVLIRVIARLEVFEDAEGLDDGEAGEGLFGGEAHEVGDDADRETAYFLFDGGFDEG